MNEMDEVRYVEKKEAQYVPSQMPPSTGGPYPPVVPVQPPMGQQVVMGYAHGYKPLPHPPVILDTEEHVLDYRKPKFRAYTPAIFAFFFGLIIWFLFTVGLGGGGFFGGIILWFLLMFIIYTRFYKKLGYWFTSMRIIIHDGTKIMMVPYKEIALSSISFEKDSAMFNTIYNKEFILKGIEGMEHVIKFITNKISESQVGYK